MRQRKERDTGLPPGEAVEVGKGAKAYLEGSDYGHLSTRRWPRICLNPGAQITIPEMYVCLPSACLSSAIAQHFGKLSWACGQEVAVNARGFPPVHRERPSWTESLGSDCTGWGWAAHLNHRK